MSIDANNTGNTSNIQQFINKVNKNGDDIVTSAELSQAGFSPSIFGIKGGGSIKTSELASRLTADKSLQQSIFQTPQTPQTPQAPQAPSPAVSSAKPESPKLNFAPYSKQINMENRDDGSFVAPSGKLTLAQIQSYKETGIHQSEMPQKTADGFNPQKEIIEKYKEPAPGVRKVHEMGITGKGVNVAIIDGGLTPHAEYNSQIKSITAFGYKDGIKPDSHAAAVTSQLAGKTCGSAPDANIQYYAAEMLPNSDPNQSNDKHLKALKDILEKNKKASDKDKIQVVSVSWGFRQDKADYPEVLKTIKELEDSGVAVFWPGQIGLGERNPDAPPNELTIWEGVGRKYGKDPAKTDSVKPNYWSSPESLAETAEIIEKTGMKQIIIPCDNKTVASSIDGKSFDYYPNGGMSWGTPTIAGVYCLAKEANPNITPKEFHQLAYETGTDMLSNGKPVGRVIDAEKLIGKIKQTKK